MNPAVIRCAIAFLIGLAADVAQAQNLLANGNFDVDLSGWDLPQPNSVDWSTFDINGPPLGDASGSGSAHGFVSGPMGTRAVIVKQCVPIAEPGMYIFGATVFMFPVSPVGTGVGNYTVSYNDTVCSSVQIVGGFYMYSSGTWNNYTSGTALNVPAPGYAAMSISVSLSVETQDTLATVVGAWFDSVYLTRDTVFLDGFD
jgi:hypothetical protein